MTGELPRPKELQLWGIAEIASAISVKPQTVCNWIARKEDFPKPAAILKMGRIYHAYDVLVWLNRHGKIKA